MTNCGNCDRQLICRNCGAKFHLMNQDVYETYYDGTEELVCPHCEEVMTCEYCGFAYQGDEENEMRY